MVILLFLQKKIPTLKLSLGLYPIVVCMALFPVLPAMEALGIAMFIFYLSLPCPFLILFTQKHKRVFCKSLYFEWLPVMLFYFVISVSSHGGAVQEEEKSVCVLYQTNFVYLMLDDMRPAAPTAWGIYPHIDNQNVYYEYFKLGKEHIPEIIFLVGVPIMYNYCGQREEYCEFCSEIKSLIADNYALTENLSIYITGCIRKYVLASDNETFQESLEKIFAESEQVQGSPKPVFINIPLYKKYFH